MYLCLYYFCQVRRNVQEIFDNLRYVIWSLVEYELCMNIIDCRKSYQY